MDALIGLLLLVATIGAFWGTIQLFRKGHRKRGLIYIAGAVCAVAVTGFVVGIKNERDARAAGFASYEEQQAAEEAEQERLISEMLAQRAEEQRVEQARLDAEAREQGYADHAALLAAQGENEQATEPTGEEARQARLARKTAGMAESIAATIQAHYGTEPEAPLPGEPFCREDGYCALTTGPFRVQVYGAGIALVDPTNQASRTDYLEICGVVFAAISGSKIMFAGEVVGETFGAALRDGSFEREVSGVEIRFSPSSDGTMGCRFFKY